MVFRSIGVFLDRATTQKRDYSMSRVHTMFSKLEGV